MGSVFYTKLNGQVYQIPSSNDEIPFHDDQLNYYWKLDSGSTSGYTSYDDVSNEELLITLGSGTPRFMTDRLGEPAGCLEMTNGYLQTLDIQNQLKNTNSKTINLWLQGKTSDNTFPSQNLYYFTNSNGIFQYGTGTTSSSRFMIYTNVYSGITLDVLGTAIYSFIQPTGSTQYHEQPNPGDWHMVTAIYNGKEIKLYVDAVLKSTETIELVSDGDYVLYGAWISDFGTNSYWKGFLDDLRIYNYELRPEQIENLYNET